MMLTTYRQNVRKLDVCAFAQRDDPPMPEPIELKSILIGMALGCPLWTILLYWLFW